MSGVATAIAASAVIGAVASNNAAQKQKGAAGSAAQQQWDIYQQNRADQAPWRNSGKAALGQLDTLTAPGGDFNRNFTMADYQADPGYAFRMQEGMKALQGSAAARGGLLSGGTMKDLTGYAQGLASQEYGNAFGRFETQNNDRYNRLASLAGLGQTATAQTGQMGANAAFNAGNFGMQGANAQAGGYLGIANTLNNGLNNWATYNAMQGSNGFNPYSYGGGQEAAIQSGSGMLGGSSYMPPIV